MEPIIRAETEDEIIVVFCNRCGMEDETVYAGTSAVIGIKQGEVSVYGMLGRCEKSVLVVDTAGPPLGKLVFETQSWDGAAHEASSPGDPAAAQSSEPVGDGVETLSS